MSKRSDQVILIHPKAPLKPEPGAPCNGCGVCCLLEPCPLGILLSRHRHGACVAVRWLDDVRQYRCSIVSKSVDLPERRLPRPLQQLASWPGAILKRLAKRWIAADQGCDSTVEVGRAAGSAKDFMDNA